MVAFLIILLIPLGLFTYANIDNTIATVDNAEIIKETVTELTNDGTNKYVIHHLKMNLNTEPEFSEVFVQVKCYGKKGKYLGEQSYIEYGFNGETELVLPKYRGGIKKVEIIVFPHNNKLFPMKKVLFNTSTSKLIKNISKIDSTYEVYTPTYSSTDSEEEYYSDYGSDYDNYNSYYDSDYDSGYDSYNDYDSEEVTGGSYVASKNSDKFHHSYCGHAERIKSNNRIYFNSRQEALDSGYDPCKSCNP